MERQTGLRGLGLAALAGMALIADAGTGVAQTSAKFGFSITLSKEAAQRLAASGEGISVNAYFYGEPKKGAERHADEMGQIALGLEEISLTGRPGDVTVSGSTFEQAKVKWLAGPVMVNVNVFSSRKAGPDNILSCDLIDRPLPDVQRKPFAVHCALISENVPSGLKP